MFCRGNQCGAIFLFRLFCFLLPGECHLEIFDLIYYLLNLFQKKKKKEKFVSFHRQKSFTKKVLRSFFLKVFLQIHAYLNKKNLSHECLWMILHFYSFTNLNISSNCLRFFRIREKLIGSRAKKELRIPSS